MTKATAVVMTAILGHDHDHGRGHGLGWWPWPMLVAMTRSHGPWPWPAVTATGHGHIMRSALELFNESKNPPWGKPETPPNMVQVIHVFKTTIGMLDSHNSKTYQKICSQKCSKSISIDSGHLD